MSSSYLKNKGFEFEKDKIVVGGDLRSLLYATFRGLPLIYCNPLLPFRFDRLSHDKLSILGFRCESDTYAREVWERISFFMGLSGLLLSGEGCNALRVRDNQLIMSTEFTKFKFNFKKLVIVDDSQISGLPRVVKQRTKQNRVIDWVNVRSGCRHSIDFLEDADSDFVKEIFFYSSERSDNPNLKDLVAVSYLNDRQLRDFDFSDTMAKFKITKMMKAAGIRGARNGRDQKYPDKYKYYAVKVEPAERQVISSVTRYYEEDERFEHCYDSLETILDEATLPSGYLGKIMESM